MIVAHDWSLIPEEAALSSLLESEDSFYSSGESLLSTGVNRCPKLQVGKHISFLKKSNLHSYGFLKSDSFENC